MPRSKTTQKNLKKESKLTTPTWDRVPKEFEILNHRITVELKDAVEGDKNGVTDFDTDSVTVFTTGKTTDDILVHTYFHELAHILFQYAGYPDDCKDETKVDVIGGLLAQWFRSV